MSLDYPDMFKFQKDDLSGYFHGFSKLTDLGFQETNFIPDVIKTLQLHHLPLSVFCTRFVKNFGHYKIMLFVKKLSVVQDNQHYFVSAKILLDNNNELVKTSNHKKPSIVFYDRQSKLEHYKKITTTSYMFFDTYSYSFVNISTIDDDTELYTFNFFNQQHLKIAQLSNYNTDINANRLNECSMLINGKYYNLMALKTFNKDLETSQRLELIEYVASLSDEQLVVLNMFLI